MGRTFQSLRLSPGGRKQRIEASHLGLLRNNHRPRRYRRHMALNPPKLRLIVCLFATLITPPWSQEAKRLHVAHSSQHRFGGVPSVSKECQLRRTQAHSLSGCAACQTTCERTVDGLRRRTINPISQWVWRQYSDVFNWPLSASGASSNIAVIVTRYTLLSVRKSSYRLTLPC